MFLPYACFSFGCILGAFKSLVSNYGSLLLFDEERQRFVAPCHDITAHFLFGMSSNNGFITSFNGIL
jgi:hypothetical protein